MLSSYLKVDEVARILSVSDFSVRRFIKQGLLPATKIGGQWRVKESVVADLLNNTQHNHASI